MVTLLQVFGGFEDESEMPLVTLRIVEPGSPQMGRQIAGMEVVGETASR